MRAATALAAAALLGAGCGRYADFGLPRPEGRAGAVKVTMLAEEAPVLEPGPPGSFDAVDVLNPAVVRHGGEYLCLYSGYDGRTWHTGVAASADGVRWSKRGKALSPDKGTWEGEYIAANGAALARGGEILYWYQAGAPPRIGLARSRDGREWKKEAAPVVAGGPRGSWDERAVGDPYVIESGEWVYMVYLGEDRARRQRLGLARSRDGMAWEKSRSSPMLELGLAGAFDENGLGEPAVWNARGRWWMLYTGRDRNEHRRLGLAHSVDGVKWERYSESAVLAGKAAWNEKVVCDPEVEANEEGARVWFGGGDVAHPAENVHGRIGVARLRFEGNE